MTDYPVKAYFDPRKTRTLTGGLMPKRDYYYCSDLSQFYGNLSKDVIMFLEYDEEETKRYNERRNRLMLNSMKGFINDNLGEVAEKVSEGVAKAMNPKLHDTALEMGAMAADEIKKVVKGKENR